MPEASIGFHTDCGFSYILSHLPGHLGMHYEVLNRNFIIKKNVTKKNDVTFFVVLF